MFGGLVGHSRGVWTTHNDGNALPATLSGDFIGPGGTAGITGYTNQIKSLFAHFVICNLKTKDFIDELHDMRLGGKFSQHLQT